MASSPKYRHIVLSMLGTFQSARPKTAYCSPEQRFVPDDRSRLTILSVAWLLFAKWRNMRAANYSFDAFVQTENGAHAKRNGFGASIVCLSCRRLDGAQNMARSERVCCLILDYQLERTGKGCCGKHRKRRALHLAPDVRAERKFEYRIMEYDLLSATTSSG